MSKGLKKENGFTLLEVLLTMVILAIISVSIWTTFSQSFEVRSKLRAAEDRTHLVRTFLSKLSQDVSMLYLVKEKKFHTLLKGIDQGVADEFTFTTFSNLVYEDSGARSDQIIVTYYTETNRQEPQFIDIRRWSNPYIEDEQHWQERRGITILPQVKMFDLSYYDGQEFKKEWDTTLIDFAGKIPQAVKIELEMADGRKYSDLFLTKLTKVLGSEPLKYAAKKAPTPTSTPTAKPTPQNTPVPQGLGEPKEENEGEGQLGGGGFD